MTFAKIGPRTNRNTRRPVARSSSSTSVPVMSEGMRSGVNWMRPNESASTSDSVWMSSVFARPGTPTNRQWPRAKSAMEKVVDDVFLADDALADPLGEDRAPRLGHLAHGGQVAIRVRHWADGRVSSSERRGMGYLAAATNATRGAACHDRGRGAHFSEF